LAFVDSIGHFVLRLYMVFLFQFSLYRCNTK